MHTDPPSSKGKSNSYSVSEYYALIESKRMMDQGQGGEMGRDQLVEVLERRFASLDSKVGCEALFDC